MIDVFGDIGACGAYRTGAEYSACDVLAAVVRPAAGGVEDCDGPTGGLGLFPAAAEERTVRNRQVLQPMSAMRRCGQLVPPAWEE
jgi:hypothetical protein